MGTSRDGRDARSKRGNTDGIDSRPINPITGEPLGVLANDKASAADPSRPVLDDRKALNNLTDYHGRDLREGAHMAAALDPADQARIKKKFADIHDHDVVKLGRKQHVEQRHETNFNRDLTSNLTEQEEERIGCGDYNLAGTGPSGRMGESNVEYSKDGLRPRLDAVGVARGLGAGHEVGVGSGIGARSVAAGEAIAAGMSSAAASSMATYSAGGDCGTYMRPADSLGSGLVPTKASSDGRHGGGGTAEAINFTRGEGRFFRGEAGEAKRGTGNRKNETQLKATPFGYMNEQPLAAGRGFSSDTNQIVDRLIQQNPAGFMYGGIAK